MIIERNWTLERGHSVTISNSVITNPSSFHSLRNLNQINRNLDVTQNRVSTGLKVTGALDDASNFAIAQGIRGEVRAISAIQQGLNNAKGLGDVTIAALTAMSNLNQDIRTKLTELSNEGLTEEQRTILIDDYEKMILQSQKFADEAYFNGRSLIALPDFGLSQNVSVLSNLQGGNLELTSISFSGITLNYFDRIEFSNMVNELYFQEASALRNGDPPFRSPADVAQFVLARKFSDYERVTHTYLANISAEVRALELQTTWSAPSELVHRYD